MAKKPLRDLSMEDQLARGPMDLPFLMLTMMLLAIGLIMVFSASYASAYYESDISSPLFYIMRQGFYALVGIAFMYFISNINYNIYSIPFINKMIFWGTVALLLLVYSPLGVTLNNARRWISLGPIQFQPSEIAKVTLILVMSARLAKRDSRKKLKWKNRTLRGRLLNFLEKIGFIELIPYGLILVAIALPVVLQPHMSGTILILVGAAAVLYVGGINGWWFVAGVVSVASSLWIIITQTAYMQTRVDLWKNPFDPLLDGYQIQQSLIAIGSGGLLGVGLGESMQKILYVPEPENDFIFAIVVEELGFVGATIIIALFVLLVLRGYWLALHARDRYGALIVVGITTLLAVQVFLNIAVVTNLIPTTGISLPFFSYGGTALIIQLAEMGIILSVSRQIPAVKQE